MQGVSEPTALDIIKGKVEMNDNLYPSRIIVGEQYVRAEIGGLNAKQIIDGVGLEPCIGTHLNKLS